MNPKRIFHNGIVQIIISVLLAALTSFLYLMISEFTPSTFSILGISFISFGLIWGFLFIIIYLSKQIPVVWLLFPFFILTSIGLPFLLQEINLLDFFLYIGVDIGICLLIAGIYWKLFGLIIPGALLVGIAPGLYFAWENTTANNPLEQIGIMLVGFAFGWGLITVTSRTLTKKIIWWPLIPGGILAVVGWGLYIAGNPESAIGFIGNTGSVGLIIFGIYILLMRRSFHQ
ncbi:MAG: hypothetical protein CVU40_02645 [Chloroflexi bacterium HGW-Chloroflexi-2]|nr:MAG: hypothetical protein CVU40_02645 [Chloroflexi bacterium HGW-Chloroflexi-2]